MGLGRAAAFASAAQRNATQRTRRRATRGGGGRQGVCWFQAHASRAAAWRVRTTLAPCMRVPEPWAPEQGAQAAAAWRQCSRTAPAPVQRKDTRPRHRDRAPAPPAAIDSTATLGCIRAAHRRTARAGSSTAGVGGQCSAACCLLLAICRRATDAEPRQAAAPHHWQAPRS